MTGEKKNKVARVLFYGIVAIVGMGIGIWGLQASNPEPISPVFIGIGMGVVAVGGIVAGYSLLPKKPAIRKH